MHDNAAAAGFDDAHAGAGGEEFAAGDHVVLDGPLGAGKTVLARGIAAGLGVQGMVTSPTFVIAREHRPGPRPDGGSPVPMVHVDAYRLGYAVQRAADVTMPAYDGPSAFERARIVR